MNKLIDKNQIPEPPKRFTQSTRIWMIEISDWEKKYNILYSDYFKNKNENKQD